MRILIRGGAEITSLILGVVSTLWVSRAVGPTYFGYFAVMVTILAVGALVINAGLSTAGSQRVANDPGKAGEVAWIVTVSRALIAVVAIVAGLVVLVIAPADPILRDYLRVGLLVWAVSPFRSEWVLVAQGRLQAISALRVAGSVATAVASILFVHDVSDAGRIAWIPVVAAVASAAGSSLVVHRQSPFHRPAGIQLAPTIRAYLRAGLHYLKSDVSVFIFTSSDRLFLYVFATPAVVGLYEAAYRVIQPFYTISAVITDAMYLQLAQSFGTDRLRPTFRRYVDLMCFATIPLGFFLVAFAPTVVSILYGTKYTEASGYLAVLGWVITFGYTSGVAVTPFSAWNRPREYGNSTGLGGAANLALNFALIPPFGGLGAAWATVAAKVVVTIAGIRYFRQATEYPLVRDLAEYLVVSGIALATALLVSRVVPDPSFVGMVAFSAVYLVAIAVVRWQHRMPLTRGSIEVIAVDHPDVS